MGLVEIVSGSSVGLTALSKCFFLRESSPVRGASSSCLFLCLSDWSRLEGGFGAVCLVRFRIAHE